MENPVDRARGELLFRDPNNCMSFWSPDPASGWGEVHLSPATSNVLGFAFGRQVIEEGDEVPLHHHKRHEEVLHVAQGTGVGIFDSGDHALYPGLTVFVGRNRAHGLRNTGKGLLIIVYVCLPPGLEYVLEAVGAPRKAGEPRPQSVKRRDPATLGELGALWRFCSTPGPAE